ncbi:hypothetical protein CHS0354_017735 [Potamilus streckersoni]|uniref:Neural proliferation differentiation and control protein 1 n=1 Tax=Potamilus streckersoni TaxID=2493646 RepID=A0AAE0SJ34_9BIVA|nr:hypothetical protein CHS0354_017735 [Potamilus streckersoni]
MAWFLSLTGLLLILPGFYSSIPVTDLDKETEIYDQLLSYLEQMKNAENTKKRDGTNSDLEINANLDTEEKLDMVLPERETIKEIATVISSSPPSSSKILLHPTPVHQILGEKKEIPLADKDFWFVVIVAGCSVAALIGIIMAGVCWYKLHNSVKAASEVDYPAYGVTGPTKERSLSPGDRKLAQSAQMYHYQHQKQQMLAMEKANGEMKHDASEDDSEEENEEGDYTVYECPGLAPAGEMEVTNPLFKEDVHTPVSPIPGDKE